MTTDTELAKHIDQPEQRHRLVLLDARHLRCLDCTQTVLLASATSTAGSTSTSSRPAPHPGQSCPHHLGEWTDTCRGCAADTKAATTTRQPARARGVDPRTVPAWTALRERTRR